jgi:hypothetical protein
VADTVAPADPLSSPPPVTPRPAALELIARLCEALTAESVRYCHWKSTATLDRAQLGEGDLDLLVERRSSQGFLHVLRRLGFKEARGGRELPGVFHAYGLDAPSGKLVHVHAHYALVLGDDMTKNYRLPVEDAYLASATQGPVFRVPAPEFELAVLVIRLALKHATWDAIVIGLGPLSRGEQHELDDLSRRVPPAVVHECVRTHVPFVGESVWEGCRRALQPGAGLWSRVRAARRLESSLAGCARRPWTTDTLLKLSRRAGGFLMRRLARGRRQRLRLDSGGAIVAIVGGEDAERSRIVTALHAWLARDFETLTLRPSSDREHALARRLASLGALVMCDGFPVSADARADVVVHLGPRGTPDAERGSEHAMATFAVEPGRPHEGVVRDVKRYVWSSL